VALMSVPRASVDAVFDTNILIDYLVGRDEALQAFERYPRRAVSVVTWIELQVGTRNADEADVVELFLREFALIDINRRIARTAVALRRRTRIRLPDALIWATAQIAGAPLLTRNTRDFPEGTPGVVVPYL